MKRAPVALCALLAASMAVGKKPPQPQTQTPTMLRVTTHLVQVNVIVLDRNGDPVKGLKRKDFKVFDNGKPQTVAVFRVESSRPPAVSLPKLPPNAYSNWAQREGYAPPTVTVILLDALNTRFADRAYARQQVMKFLEQLHPNDRVALYALGRRLVVLHDFTCDVAPLLEALRHYVGRRVSELHPANSDDSASRMLGTGSDAVPSDYEGADAQSDLSGIAPASVPQQPATQWDKVARLVNSLGSLDADYVDRQRVKLTTDALIAIANHLRGLPGRKNLIWVSGSFPTWYGFGHMLRPGGFQHLQEFHSSLSGAVRALNDVNLAIYPVDARGLILDPNFGIASNYFSRDITRGFDGSIGAMSALAQRTGGHAFLNTFDILGSIRQVLKDSKVTYVLAYYPKDVKWNGEFRKIKVQVDRKHVHLQYRNGYSAMPEEQAPAAAHSETLAAVMNSPLDATGMGIVVQLVHDRKASTPGHPGLTLRVQIDPREVKFEQQDGFRVANLTLATDEFGPTGESLKRGFQKIDVHLEPEVYKKALAEGMGFREHLLFPILPDAERLRVVLRDDLTGVMGSVNVPLDRGFRPPKPSLMKRKSLNRR